MPRSGNRPRLARGLSSLIRDSTQPNAPADGEYRPVDSPPTGTASDAPATVLVAIDRIAPNPYQPRRAFDDGALASLAQSIRTHGLLQPVLVCPAPDPAGDRPYQLIAGERRLRAAQLAGVPEVPCIVRSSSRQQMLEMALIENLHRADLNPIERASAYRDLIDRFGLTQEQLAERLGQPRPTIANYLRLLDLCDIAQALLTQGKLTFGHGKVLAALTGDPERQAEIARRTVQEGLSVRQLEVLIQTAGPEAPQRAHKEGQSPDPRRAYLRDLEQQISEAVGTKVSLHPGRGKHAGRIVIHYYSLDDFDRITALLKADIES